MYMCERAKQDKHALREIITQQIIIRFTFCSRITRKRESEIEVKLKIEGHNDDKEEEEDDDRMYGKQREKYVTEGEEEEEHGFEKRNKVECMRNVQLQRN